MTILAMPLSWLLKGGRGIMGFLPLGLIGLGPLRLLLNPYFLIALGCALAIGWSYQQGKNHERALQAKAILDLNNRLSKQSIDLMRSEREAESRLGEAASRARQTFATRHDRALCSLNKNDILRLTDIAGDY